MNIITITNFVATFIAPIALISIVVCWVIFVLFSAIRFSKQNQAKGTQDEKKG